MSNPFSGEPSTVWTVDAQERLMRLTDDFSYVDREGRTWGAPKDMATDGASIPRALWSLVGSPFTGHYRRAALVHDYACDQAHGDRKKRREADRMFYFACRDGGCPRREAIILYVGVRIGALVDRVPAWGFVQGDVSPRLAFTGSDRRLQEDFERIAGNVLAVAEANAVEDFDVVEQQTDAAIGSVLGPALL